MAKKRTEAEMKVLRLAEANRPRSVPVRTSDRTLFKLERDYLVAATRSGPYTTVSIMPKGTAIVEAENTVAKKATPRKAGASDRTMPKPDELTAAIEGAVIALAGLSMNERVPAILRPKAEAAAKRLAEAHRKSKGGT